MVRKGDFFVKRFVSTRIAGGFLLRNGSLALQANHAQQAKAKSFKTKKVADLVLRSATKLSCTNNDFPSQPSL